MTIQERIDNIKLAGSLPFNTKVRVITPELYAKLLEIKAEREPKVDAEIVDIQDRMSKLQEELSSLQSEKTAISSK